ncbi:MAG: hypothetical protein KC561_16455 [Myxococcales bacterium]|nr:hypothetical protein [Myxococcales bacterium]
MAFEARVKRIEEIARSIADDSGLYLYDLELSRGQRFQLRIAIDRIEKAAPSDGVTVGELTAFNREIDRALEMEAILGEDYALEVSSPGLERKLKTSEHFRGAIGEYVVAVLDDGSSPEGTLTAVNDDTIVLEGTAGPVEVQRNRLKRARTVFK